MKFIILLFFSISVFGQNISINEIMSKNESTISNGDNEYNDWIELYNSNSQPIYLGNYYLSDNETELQKWKLPNITIPAHSYILFFASGKDYISDSEIHTNFKITSDGEAIFLSNEEGEIHDYIPAVNLCSDRSYGKLPDGSDNMLQLNTASPNNSNNINNQLLFSKQNGFYNQPFYLTINSLMGDTIYYTLDGSSPTIHSQTYTNPIYIEDRTHQPNYFSNIPSSPSQSQISFHAWEEPNGNVNKITTIRCASFRNGVLSSEVYTRSYFVDQEAILDSELPIIAISTEEQNLFNHESGIYVPGTHFNATNPEWTGNYFHSGKLWEKQAHIEFFDSTGELKFMQEVGLRIHGGKTRHAAQKSMKIYAGDEYRTLEFNHQLFPQSQNSNYKRFLLRTTMGAWNGQTIITDILAHDIARSLNIEIQNFQPAVVFINGEYWGIQTLRNKIDEYYIQNLYGIDKDSIDIIGGNYNLVFAGDNLHYINLLDFIAENSLSDNHNYEYICSQIDIDNYIDYQIAELFFANYDWPANNMKLWRPKTKTGRWRWIFYDIDAGFSDYDYNMLEHATRNDNNISWPNSPQSTLLFRSLLENSNFKQQFIDRYATVLKHYFNTSNMLIKPQNIKKIYDNEIHRHIDRWHYPSSFSRWEDDIDESLIQFLEKRPCKVSENIIEFFNLDNFDYDCSKDYNQLNLNLSPNPNKGILKLSNNTDTNLSGSITISATSGKICYEEKLVFLNASDHKVININHLPNGIYFINYSSSLFTEVKKLVKVN